MILFELKASTDVNAAALSRSLLLDAYESALRRCQATVVRVGEDELSFRVSTEPPPRLSLSDPDLGLVSGGTIEVAAAGGGFRVTMRARPRNWFLILSMAPWLLLLWGLGFTTAPWRWLTAFGGLPLVALLWTVVWANLHTFMDHTNRAVTEKEGTE